MMKARGKNGSLIFNFPADSSPIKSSESEADLAQTQQSSAPTSVASSKNVGEKVDVSGTDLRSKLNVPTKEIKTELSGWCSSKSKFSHDSCSFSKNKKATKIV